MADPGVGFGIDLHNFADNVAVGAQALVPIARHFALVARPIVTGGATAADLDAGGRLEVQLHSGVYRNLLRVYFGVGPQAFYEIRGSEAHHVDVSGGWDVGLEAFLSQRFAVHWEMGTSGGGVTAGAGPSYAVGFRAYPGWLRS